MCFTIEIKLTRETIEKRFKVETDILEDFRFQSYYRAFDKPLIPVISQDNPDTVSLKEWGLIPGWVNKVEQAVRIREGTFNARSETVHTKASFKKAFHAQRCWVIAHGFFEWQHRGKSKIPWYIFRKDGQPFAFAGLYDKWKNPITGEIKHTCSILTTRANPLMEHIHNSKKRMPVILTPENEADWINPDSGTKILHELLGPLNEELLSAHTVSQAISTGKANENTRDILEKFEYPEQSTLF